MTTLTQLQALVLYKDFVNELFIDFNFRKLKILIDSRENRVLSIEIRYMFFVCLLQFFINYDILSERKTTNLMLLA